MQVRSIRLPPSHSLPLEGSGSGWGWATRSALEQPSSLARQPGHGRIERQLLLRAGLALLEFDHALFEAARPDDHLPRQADQIHRGELGAGRFLALVVERVD